MPNNVKKPAQDIDKVAWATIKSGAYLIAAWIRDNIGDNAVVYGIPRGGMIPAITITHQLEGMGLRARFLADIYAVTPPEIPKLVVVDEICDSGDTFRTLKQLFPMAKTATIFHRVGAKFTADYHPYTIDDDRWLRFPWEADDACS